jgi:hypothetical protein
MMTVSATKSPADMADGWANALQAPRLSTDFLNRYSEALMLLEMALIDESILDDLKAWRSVDYCAHFQASQLRCAPSALAAYERVAPGRRAAFEELCRAMTRLVTTVTALLADAPANLDLTSIVDVASEALRKLIGRATRFINANGSVDVGAFDDHHIQDEIDALLAG